MDVVVVLGSVVEETLIGAEGLLDDFLDRQVGKASFRCELVAVVDIGLVVLVVVIFERLLRHEGNERFVIIGKCGKFEGHWSTPFRQNLG
ncbi:hypothetical protein D3C80_413940 [compost metagenome]